MRGRFEDEQMKVKVLISQIINKVAIEGGYDYIIRRENLAYAVDNENDISTKVLEQAHKNY
nr:OmpH family outer membrane protein [Candidatus Colwellia aromaticivorans]